MAGFGNTLLSDLAARRDDGADAGGDQARTRGQGQASQLGHHQEVQRRAGQLLPGAQQGGQLLHQPPRWETDHKVSSQYTELSVCIYTEDHECSDYSVSKRSVFYTTLY